MNNNFRGLRWALEGWLFCALALVCGASQKLDVKSMLDWGWVQTQCTTLDMGQVGNVFDGDTSTIIRTPGINPLVLTLTFSETQYISGFRIWFLAGWGG